MNQQNQYHEFSPIWKKLLEQGLAEDHWQYDWTSLGSLKKPGQKIKARVIAKADGIWAGQSLVEALSSFSADLDDPIQTKSLIADGTKLKAGTAVTEWSGSARMVLTLERTFLNLASYVSGIATSTRRLVDKVKFACPKRPPRVTPTRKTLPGYRDLAIHGVRIGGGFSHRVSLSGGVLIKENHIASAGGIARAIEGVRAVSPHGLRIEIEVRNEKELQLALAEGVDGVLLDNFRPQQIRPALQRIDRVPRRPIVEVSGGLTEMNIADYAIEGVDVLSVGWLTHSVRALDLSLLVQS